VDNRLGDTVDRLEDTESSVQNTPLTEQAKEKAQQALGTAQEKAAPVIDKAKDQVRTQITTQKERATGSLESVASVLHQTSQHLQDQGQGAVGEYADTAAQQIERLSQYLRDRDVDQMVMEVEGFARRQPALFLGGAFVLGVALARFLKSSSPRQAAARRGYIGSTAGPTTILGRTDVEPTGPIGTPPYTAHNYVPGGVAGAGSGAGSGSVLSPAPTTGSDVTTTPDSSPGLGTTNVP